MASVFAIVPAAGLGTRMSSIGGAPKQFLELGGTPILVHTIAAIACAAEIAGIWVAVRPGEQTRLQDLLQAHAASLPAQVPVHIVVGGDTRQASVTRALEAIECPDDAVVLVHDAVRPLVEPAAIDRVVAAARKHGAAIVAVAATDTIKQVERTAQGALITGTLPRESIVQAQTPQAALAGLLRRAVAEAEADEFAGTDEAGLLERAGIPVAAVPGDASNLKITRAADLPLAEWYLAQRTGGSR